MCKVKKALLKGDFRALETMNFSSNDVESILTDAEAELEEDEIFVEENEDMTPGKLSIDVELAKKRIEENRSIIENAEKLLEMMEQRELMSEMLYED